MASMLAAKVRTILKTKMIPVLRFIVEWFLYEFVIGLVKRVLQTNHYHLLNLTNRKLGSNIALYMGLKTLR